MLRRALILTIGVCLLSLGHAADAAFPAQGTSPKILLRSRQFTPPAGIETNPSTRAQSQSGVRHVLLQLQGIPTEAEKQRLAASGIRLLRYVPEYAWFAAVETSVLQSLKSVVGVHWLGEVQRSDKLPARLLRGEPAAYAERDGFVTLRVVYFDDVSESGAMDALTRHGGIVEVPEPLLHTLTARVPTGAVAALADEDAIMWLAELPPTPTPANDKVRERMRVNDVQAAPYNLTGSGVKIGIWDCSLIWPHVDFAGRLTQIASELPTCGDGTQNHPTHVAGILAGSGLNSQPEGGTGFQWKGVAPGAQLISYDFEKSTAELSSAITTYGIDLSQNSWSITPNPGESCELVYGNYNNLAPDYDKAVTGAFGKRIAVLFAAGNMQRACGTWNSITPPGTAKDVITVGATNALDDAMPSFSSWGPTDDGRTKPDVVAPGFRDDFPGASPSCTSNTSFTGIKSTCPNNGYGLIVGTSMATPAVSGVLALLLQQYRATLAQPLANPLPSTLKALVIHGAVDLGNSGPDYKFGWGRVDAKNSVDLVRSSSFSEGVITTGQAISLTVNVPPCQTQFKATLVWDDPAATDNALFSYINDLDLTLISPNGKVFQPWLLDPNNPGATSTTGTDRHRNNVEQVAVTNPIAGDWTMRVHGFEVPQGPQSFSLVRDFVSVPSLSSVTPSAAQPGAQIDIHGSGFCESGGTSVNLAGVTVTLPAGSFTFDTISVTVPLTATTGQVSVATRWGTSNALQLAVVRPQLYLPSTMLNFPPPFSWIDASSGARIVPDDDVTQTVALPFPFTFYTSTYTSVIVSSNGFISFGQLHSSFKDSSCLPSVGAPNNAIYAFWSDLVPAASPDSVGIARAVFMKTVGASFVIEWLQVPRYGTNELETFEIVLGADNSIRIQYLVVNNTNDVVAGVENFGGTSAFEVYCNRSNTTPPSESGTRPANLQRLYFTAS